MRTAMATALAAALVSTALLGTAPRPAAAAAASQPPPPLTAPGTGRSMDYPAALSAPDLAASPPRRRLSQLTADPAVATCLRRCMPGCVRGGAGAPGLGPAAVRRDPVVFGEGFRDRSTCLRECSEVCALKVEKAGGDGKK